MFLAIKEMKFTKAKYGLIIFVLLLITWLVAVLSGLAHGLAEGNRLAVDQWQASGVIVSKEANKSLNASTLSYAEKGTSKVQPIVQLAVAVQKNQQTTKRNNVSVFGVASGGFLAPKVTSGRLFLAENEVVLSQDFQQWGYHLGDKFYAGTYKQPLKVVGWTKKSTYNIVPVLYTSSETAQSMKFGSSTGANGQRYNGLIVRGDKKVPEALQSSTQWISIAGFIEALPGYQAQNITLDTMIYFLIIIGAFVIGIFIYILTLQKTAMFGVLKVQGVPAGYLIKAVFSQTVILAVIGVALGLVATFLTVLVLPASMPYSTDVGGVALDCLLLIAAASVGSLFSAWTVKKVNPLVAIGG